MADLPSQVRETQELQQMGAYWSTASTSFANPALTLARAVSSTLAGIRPLDAPGFIVTQLAGAAAATWVFRWLAPSLAKDTRALIVSHRLLEHAPL